MPNFIIGTTTYNYAEVKFGNNRGISVWRSGVPNDVHQYTLDPNPHDDPWYNKNQPAFYRQAAQVIANTVEQTQAYPAFGTVINVHDIQYTLGQR